METLSNFKAGREETFVVGLSCIKSCLQLWTFGRDFNVSLSVIFASIKWGGTICVAESLWRLKRITVQYETHNKSPINSSGHYYQEFFRVGKKAPLAFPGPLGQGLGVGECWESMICFIVLASECYLLCITDGQGQGSLEGGLRQWANKQLLLALQSPGPSPGLHPQHLCS